MKAHGHPVSLSFLLLREIRYRRVNFMLGVFAVAAICGGAGAGVLFLRFDHRESLRMGNGKSAALEGLMRRMRSEYRDLTERMGPTIRLVPPGERGDDFYSDGFAAATLDESVMDTLRRRFGGDLRFALPLVKKKIVWGKSPGRKVLCTGVGTLFEGSAAGCGRPDIDPPPPSEVILGYELHRGAGVRPGDIVDVAGHGFRVHDTATQRGSIDDITLRMSADDFRQLTGVHGVFHEILLWPRIDTVSSAPFSFGDRLSAVTGCRAVVSKAKALLQVRARMTAAAAEREALDRERRGELARHRRRMLQLMLLSSVLITAACIGAIILSAQNLFDRRGELAALYAIGVHGDRLTALVALRAALMGAAGSVIGTAAVFAAFRLLRPAMIAASLLTMIGAGGAALMIAAALAAAAPVKKFIERAPVAALMFEGGGT